LLDQRPLALAGLGLAHGLHVAPGTEALARSRDDHHAHVGVGRAPRHRIVEIVAQRAAEGVEPIGAIQREGDDTILHLVEQAFVGHSRISLSGRHTSSPAPLPTEVIGSPPPTCDPSPWSPRPWADSSPRCPLAPRAPRRGASLAFPRRPRPRANSRGSSASPPPAHRSPRSRT